MKSELNNSNDYHDYVDADYINSLQGHRQYHDYVSKFSRTLFDADRKINDKVELKLDGSEIWENGKIVGGCGHNYYDIRLHDGSIERNVSEALIRAPNGGEGSYSLKKMSFYGIKDICVPNAADNIEIQSPYDKLSQNHQVVEETGQDADKTTTLSNNKELKFLESWVLALNVSTSSCLFHGLGDRHKDSYINWLLRTRPFRKTDTDKPPDVSAMVSLEELYKRGLLMPFNDVTYNALWGGLVPSKGKFPTGQSSFHYCKLNYHNDYFGDDKKKTGESDPFQGLVQSLSNIVNMKQQQTQPANEIPTVINFKRNFINCFSNADATPATLEISSNIINLASDTLLTYLSEDNFTKIAAKTSTETSDNNSLYRRFWDLGILEQNTMNIDWEFCFGILLSNQSEFRHLTMKQAGDLKLADIISDKSTSRPFVCTVSINLIKNKSPANVFRF